MRFRLQWAIAALLCAGVAITGCKDEKKGDDKAKAEGAAEKTEEPEFKADKGVDVEEKTIHVGALNDMSGPAAAIGKPFAVGKQLMAARANNGELLPEGWKVELHEEDTAYNQSKAVTSYKKISDDVLYIGTSFGTPPTLAVRKFLERDKVVAFPASLSTQMAENEYTPPLAPTYKFETMRAMDYAVEAAGGPDKVKAGIVYLKNDYGKDVIEGWKEAAEAHGVEIVSENPVSPTQTEMTPVVKSLQDSGANFVMLGILPNSTGKLLGTAAQMKYMPNWIGATPAWADVFFKEESPAPPAIFAKFHWATGLPYWGEDVPGMEAFLEAYEKHAADKHDRDFYILVSYIQGLIQAEIMERCIKAKDCTRANFIEEMHGVTSFDAGGMIQEIDLSEVPYVVGTKTRVLKPDFEKKSWTVAGDWAEPEAYEGEGGGDEAAEKEGGDEESGDEKGGEKAGDEKGDKSE
jgi:ABC-type branched-subunit amino acid transport system substrate-binding protein